MSYRAEQVGSLLRPPELLEARAAYAASRLSVEELRAIEDAAIATAIDKQRQIGIDILTDGELRRAGWATEMAAAVAGFTPHRVELEWEGPNGGALPSISMAAGERLEPRRHLTALELPFLQQNARGPLKITVPAPSNFLISSYKDGLTDRFYPTRRDLLADLVGIVRREIQWLVAQDVHYIQLDAPYYSHYFDNRQRERMRAAGRDPDAEFEMAIQGDNACMANVDRRGITFAVHVCRGNHRSRWYAEGGYDAIAKRLFGSLDVDRFLLEYDSERAGGFAPLSNVPKGKDVVLGLVTTKQPELESEDSLCRRIDDAARYIPLENLALSPQCGFASVADGNLISFDDQWRKLQLVVNVARKVWG